MAYDDVFILLDFMKKLEGILTSMSEETNPYSERHRKNNTAPGKYTATLALEDAELKILKLLGQKKFQKQLPILQEQIKEKFTESSKDYRERRLRELEHAERNPLNHL